MVRMKKILILRAVATRSELEADAVLKHWASLNVDMAQRTSEVGPSLSGG